MKFLENKTGQTHLAEKLQNVSGWVVCILVAVIIGFTASVSPYKGAEIIGILVGITALLICIFSAEYGLYLITAFSFSAYFLSRLLFRGELMTGLLLDAGVFAIVLGFLISKKELKQLIREFAGSAVVIITISIFAYSALEFFNPNARSFNGSFQAFRKITNTLLILFIAFYVFSDFQVIRRYLKILFGFVVAISIYGCIQEWFGLFNFEWEWLVANPHTMGLNFINGHMRVFSSLSDPAAFGMLMATCAVLFTGLLALEMTTLKRFCILSGIVLMILAMNYSGTRTANGMLVGGIAFYLLITIKQKVSIFLTLISVVIFCVAMFAPVRTPSLDRFRSTFSASKDASYQLRIQNRKFIQPYIYSHPMGGGLGTTGAAGELNHPGHYLAGFQPDSGYLKKALEIGWLGLILFFVLYFLVLKKGINSYFAVHDQNKKAVIASVTAALFTFYIGEYAQMAIGQISDVVVYYPLIAILLKAQSLQEFKPELIET